MAEGLFLFGGSMGERKSQKSEVRLKKFEPGSGMGFCSWQWVLRRIISSGGGDGLRKLKRVGEGDRVDPRLTPKERA